MTKLTVKEESASEALAKVANSAVVVEDSQGRKITLRNPGVLAQFRLAKAVGPELAQNTTYMQMVLPLLYVGAIDDDVLVAPTTDREIEALIIRLDEAGVNAVLAGVQKHFASDPEADKTATKK